MTWGGDHEGPPYVETADHKIGAGGVMTDKHHPFVENNRDIDLDA